MQHCNVLKRSLPALTLLMVIMHHQCFSQSVTLNGPSCVTTGVVYLYTVSGSLSSAATVRFCITGGTLVDSGGTCVGGRNILSFVRVAWNPGSQPSASLAATTSLGNKTIPVTIAQPMSPGMIDSAVLYQILDTATTPATLTCSAPLGGGCSFSYQFQWQQSFDNVIWQDTSGATSAQLSFTGPLSKTTYFRRVTTNAVSNAYGLSNVATLWVNIPMPSPQD